MADDFHKPTQYSNDKFDTYIGGDDPAQIMRVAHDTAHALVDRARENTDPEVLQRLVSYTDEHGIDALAELWARSSPRSLPGALWRIYLMRLLIRQDPTGMSYLFQRGTEVPTRSSSSPTRSFVGCLSATSQLRSTAQPRSAG
jgi:hypothetical protein